jgi:hypothetical protein
MKKLILILAITSGSMAFAQKVSTSDVPAIVTSKFSSLYPDSNAEQWKKEKGNYETNFKQSATKMCIVIDPKGNVVKTSTEISISELPASVNEYVVKNCKNDKIKEAFKTTEADGKVKYEAEVKDHRLCFDANGNFIKSEKCTKKVS